MRSPVRKPRNTKSYEDLSRCLFGNPRQVNRVKNYVEIDVRGLHVQKKADNVYLLENQTALDVSGRIISSGKN